MSKKGFHAARAGMYECPLCGGSMASNGASGDERDFRCEADGCAGSRDCDGNDNTSSADLEDPFVSYAHPVAPPTEYEFRLVSDGQGEAVVWRRYGETAWALACVPSHLPKGLEKNKIVRDHMGLSPL